MENELIKINPVIMDMVHSSLSEDCNPFTEEIFLIDVLVALGEQRELIREHVDAMHAGEELEMVRAEKHEIWLKHDGVIFGQIPLESGIIIARLMDAGKKMKCRVSMAGTHSHKMFRKPFSRVLVKIYMID